MRRLLVFQHVPHEILGTLDPLLRRTGFRIRYVNFGRQPDARPELDRYHGLVVLGGPMNCDQVHRYRHLATEVELIQTAIAAGKPVLGICLGAQLIACALGAPVYANATKEIGWYDVMPTPAAATDPLFRHLAPAQRIFQWHGDTFDIPDGAVQLARSEACENQAFRWGDNVYGLQFHLEVDAPMIRRWLHTPVNQRELAGLAGRIDAARIERETPALVPAAMQLGERLFGEFLHLFEARHRRQPLPSR